MSSTGMNQKLLTQIVGINDKLPRSHPSLITRHELVHQLFLNFQGHVARVDTGRRQQRSARDLPEFESLSSKWFDVLQDGCARDRVSSSTEYDV
jgi:hypothetical protein